MPSDGITQFLPRLFPCRGFAHLSGRANFCAHRASRLRGFSVWYVASWNVRTLLDMEGSIETARQDCNENVKDERKIDHVVSELNRYQVVVAALQETKWFGNRVYRVGDSVVLTAGREVPGRGVVRQRGEGVAIVLSGPALSAWKAGGSQWKAWNSRLVTTKLKVGSGRSSHLHILSCYAPTFAASRDEKDRFFDSLQDALSLIPCDECFVMLGDFNARVGSRGVINEWWYERGPHGYGELNEAGKELLSFLFTNEATVSNTWFKKRDICKQTWQHPKSKRWHCIDYMIVRKAHRRRCLDVSVMRGADCNTDHRLLRAKLTVGRSRSFMRDCAGASVRRWDVARLQGSSVDAKGRATTRGRYLKRIEEKLLDSWDKDSSVETKWDTLKSVLCGGANEVGYFEVSIVWWG